MVDAFQPCGPDEVTSGWGHVSGPFLETVPVKQPMPLGGSQWVSVSAPEFEDPPLVDVSYLFDSAKTWLKRFCGSQLDDR